MTKNRSWPLWRAIATLILIGLLIAGGVALYRVGWSQGYTAAQPTEGGETAPPPYARQPGLAPYAPGGGLLRAVLLIVGLALGGKLIRFIIWGSTRRFAMAGPGPVHWHAAHWHGPWSQPPEEPDADAEPEA